MNPSVIRYNWTENGWNLMVDEMVIDPGVAYADGPEWAQLPMETLTVDEDGNLASPENKANG